MAENTDPFARFINSSSEVDGFDRWIRDQEVVSGDSVDDFFAAAMLESVSPVVVYRELEKGNVAHPESVTVIVDDTDKKIILSKFLNNLGLTEEVKIIEFTHHDEENDLDIMGVCTLRVWRRDKSIMATDYRYSSLVSESSQPFRKMGSLIIRIAEEVIGDRQLFEIDTFR